MRSRCIRDRYLAMDADFLRAIIENAGAAIAACDATGEVVLMNAAARTLAPDHPLFEALRTGTEARGSCIKVRQMFDADGRKIGAATFDDSTARNLEMLLESTGEGIFGIDTEGLCTFVNGSAAAMLGYRRQDLLGKFMHGVIHNWVPESECPILQALRDGRGCRVEDEMFVRADGSRFPAEYSSFPILDGGIPRGAVVTFTDVSHRKRLEEALRLSESRYRGLFDYISEGVYQTSPNGELLATNRALVEMLGYSSENELRALDVNQLYVNPEDRRALTAQLERDGHLENAELRLLRKDGVRITLVENARAVRDERGRVAYYEGTLSPKAR